MFRPSPGIIVRNDCQGKFSDLDRMCVNTTLLKSIKKNIRGAGCFLKVYSLVLCRHLKDLLIDLFVYFYLINLLRVLEHPHINTLCVRHHHPKICFFII